MGHVGGAALDGRVRLSLEGVAAGGAVLTALCASRQHSFQESHQGGSPLGPHGCLPAVVIQEIQG